MSTQQLSTQRQAYLYLAYPKLWREQYQHIFLGPPHNANLAAQQHQQQLYQQQMAQRNAALEHQMAQRRAKKPTDRNMPDGIEDLIVGDAVQQYKELREVEKKLDYTIMRKRLDIQDTMNRNVRRQKTMRIWITNTCENQPWQRPALDENSFDFESGAESTYRVKIEGKIIDEDETTDEADEMDVDGESDAAPTKEAKSPPPKKFSSYFKAISVENDKNRQNPNLNIDPTTQVEWKKTPQSQEFDCFEFQRKGDENQNVTISLVRDEPVERYRLSQALANTLDMEEADRAEVVMGIWEYVKAMGLQEDDERRHIFNADAFLFPQVAERIMPHLHPLPPLKLQYTIRVDQEFQSVEPQPTIYDIKITTDDPLRSRIMAITSSSQTAQNLRQINTIDEQLAVVIQAIQHHKAKHTFYKNFNRDPVGFLKKWHSSQQRDLSVILGEMERGDVAGLEFAKGGSDGVWGSDIVGEAVRYKLARGEAMRG
ncbi:uncharacterized protein HMPREF1541_10722 [Cyphellophora europaea CBS 101466]|uniref:SWIB domain-containing protein n=1 Tax=Cyphellophora europaea (strain CBS 101466) TaxID=1220924 RepID=W2S642_CYPE1|nr:uncharacterized protein HMPREF1541_10722 [Cyphellophora europaea CBS 101466]ETN44172.1 hypothetical protein HMPREF1541_10722 [Cyphellophora europaea CBS 101466]